MSQKGIEQVPENNLQKVASGESTGKGLTAKQRLQLVHALVLGRCSAKKISLDIKGVDGSILSELCGGAEFDTLDIDIHDDKENSRFDIVMAMKVNAKRLPRGISFSVSYDGSLGALLEMDITKQPPGSHSFVGMEGTATFIDMSAGDPELLAHKHKGGVLNRLNALLELAGCSQRRIISLN